MNELRKAINHLEAVIDYGTKGLDNEEASNAEKDIQQAIHIIHTEMTAWDKSPWISVEDRLPEVCEVLFLERGNVHVGGQVYVDEMGRKMWRNKSGVWYKNREVTHWQPIDIPQG